MSEEVFHVRFTDVQRAYTAVALSGRYASAAVWIGSNAPDVLQGFARLRKIARRDLLHRHGGQSPKSRRSKRGGKRVL